MIDSILQFLGAFGSRAGKYGVLYLLVFLVQVVRFDLAHQETWLTATMILLWLIIWWVTVWRIAALVGLVASALMIWTMVHITFTDLLPRTSVAVRTNIETVDRRAVEAITHEPPPAERPEAVPETEPPQEQPAPSPPLQGKNDGFKPITILKQE